MKIREAFQNDCFALTPATGAIRSAFQKGRIAAGRKSDLQQILRQDGWLRTTAVSGGDLADRRRIVHAALVQARRRGIPFLLLSAESPMPGLSYFRYDPFSGNSPSQASFLLAQTARVRNGYAPDEIAFSLNALLRCGGKNNTLDGFLSASCEEWEAYAQEQDDLPFAQREEFRRVFYLMEELRRTRTPDLPTASLSSALHGGEAQIVITSPFHWAMVLKEAENLPVPALLACEEIPFSELPDCMEMLLRNHVLIGAKSLPECLTDALWETLISRVFISVVFRHSSAYAAEKLARYYGMHDEILSEQNRTVTKPWLSPWERTTSFGQTDRTERRYQILPEEIQQLASGKAVISCAGQRRICTFKEGS